MGEDDTTYHGAEYSVHSGNLCGHITIQKVSDDMGEQNINVQAGLSLVQTFIFKAGSGPGF